MSHSPNFPSRRAFLADTGMGFTGLALSAMLFRDGVAQGAGATAEAAGWMPPNGQPQFPPKAKSVIWIFNIGGVSHLESFDPKPMLNKYANQSIDETPALVILVSAFMLERRAWRSIAATFAIAGVCLIALASYGALAGRITVQPIAGELAKLQGWSATASEIAGIARRADTDTVVTYGRALSASMTYYLRDTGLSVKAFRRPGAPGDYFEMTHPWRADDPGPVLIVKTGGPPPGISAERLDEGQCFQSRIYQHRRSGAELCAYRVE